MWITVGIVIALLLGGLGYLALQDGNFRITRKYEIDAPSASVFAAIVDLKSWPEWSPWLLHEPSADIEYSDNFQAEGGNYSWDGKLVGAGKLSHVAIKPGAEIQQQIEFLRPFKSTSRIDWKFQNRGETTLLIWEMNGRMPFLMRFLVTRMEAEIGRDFELGLALFNGYMNANSPHPALIFNGRETLDDFNYWAIPCNGNLRQVEAARHAGIEALQQAVPENSGLPLMLYQDFDNSGSSYRAEIAIPVGGNAPASNFSLRKFKGGRYYKMTLHGDLSFLPLAWHALSNHCRMEKLKLQRARPALEIYQQGTRQETASNQRITTLYLPIK